MIRVVVDEYGEDTYCEYCEGQRHPEVVGVPGQVEGVACIDRGNPHQAAPTLEGGREGEEGRERWREGGREREREREGKGGGVERV